MSDYKRPAKMIAKLTSPKGRSVKFVKSSPYGVMTYTRNIKEALPLTRHELALVRSYAGSSYKIERINPATFDPGNMSIAEILAAAKLPVQPDMFFP